VRRDEEHHAAGQQKRSQDERNQSLPAQAGGARVAGLEGANAASRLCVKDAGRLPAV